MMSRSLAEQLDAVIPGVSAAYASLRSVEGKGLYTSRGAFFDKTIFGRDAAMTAKFVVDIDHQAALDAILTLISFQGTQYNTLTQEEPGRIHHEWRDFRVWRGRFADRLPFLLLRRRWDVQRHELLTYYSLDSTALFIRLVHKYATRIDSAVLDRVVQGRDGNQVTVARAVEAAADWIIAQVDNRDLVAEYRHNDLSLPFQTFQDSLYSRADGSLAEVNERIAYVEVQAFAADALCDAAHMMPQHKKFREWREVGLRIHRAMLTQYRLPDGFLAAAIDEQGMIDVPNVSVGWVLNNFIWRLMSDGEREKYIAPIVRRLLSDEFLTNVGLRTRTLSAIDPISGVIDYHGRETVWPMFTFMVIEGLRRHRMYRLAEQLEVRLINGFNSTNVFPEFHIVDTTGVLLVPTQGKSKPVKDVQMKPEHMIGFSVVPALTLAHRVVRPPVHKHSQPWQLALEDELLSSMPVIKLAEPNLAHKFVGDIHPCRLRRWKANLRLFDYLMRHKAVLRNSNR